MNFAERVMIIWVFVNLIMAPLAFAGDTEAKVIDKVQEDTIELSGFSKITPFGNDLDDPIVDIGSVKNVFQLFFVLACVSFIGIYFAPKKKKGQVTLFILLFLVIAITFGFLFYIRNQSRGAMMESESDRILKDFFVQTNFKTYMQNCLDKVSEDGIELLGKQGGYLYNNYPNNDTTLNFRGYRINQPQILSAFTGGALFLGPHRDYCNTEFCQFFGYNAVPYKDSTGTFVAPLLIGRKVPTSTYPYEGVLRSSYNISDENVGENSELLNDLCNEDDYETDFFRQQKINYSCPISGIGESNETMQSLLTDFIQENVMNCFFGSDFFSQTLDLDVIQPNYTYLDTNLIIGEDAVNVFFDFPLNVTIGDGSSIIRNVRFTAEKKVRLKNVYDLVEAIIFMENKDVFFFLPLYDISTWDVCKGYNYTAGSFLREVNITCADMQVRVNNTWAADCNHNITGQTSDRVDRCEASQIVKVIDKRSIINGRPFEFVFAIDNRAPVLDLIDREIIADWPNSFYDDYLNTFYGGTPSWASKFFYDLNELPTSHTFNESMDDDKNIIVKAGDPLRIFPFAIDPDDPPITVGQNQINYTYEGWLSNTSITNFDYSEFIAKYPTHVNFSADIMQHYQDGDLQLQKLSTTNVWESSDYYNGDYPDLVPLLTNQDLEAKTQLYSFIYKDAYYLTKLEDVGYHIVRVYARDKNEPDLYDYQDIFIHVRCYPGDHLCCTTDADYHYDEHDNDFRCLASPPNGAGKECTYKGCCEVDASGVIDESTCEYDRSIYPLP